LAQALRRLIGDRAERQRLATNARAAAAQLPTWQDSARLFADAIELPWRLTIAGDRTRNPAAAARLVLDFRKDNGPAIRKVCARFVALCREPASKSFTRASSFLDRSIVASLRISSFLKSFSISRVSSLEIGQNRLSATMLGL
jgi:hypothetical protein